MGMFGEGPTALVMDDLALPLRWCIYIYLGSKGSEYYSSTGDGRDYSPADINQ